MGEADRPSEESGRCERSASATKPQTTQTKVPGAHGPDGTIDAKGFLHLSRQILPIVDRLGKAFFFLRGNIAENINRLEEQASFAPDALQTVLPAYGTQTTF